MELLERVAAATSPLLGVESAAGGGLLLTFEAGRVWLQALPGELRADLIEGGDAAALRGASLGEEEPWWRLVGSPLVRAREIHEGQGGGVALQFRPDAENPRVVEIVSEAGLLRVNLRPIETA